MIKRIPLLVACGLLLFVSWSSVLGMQSSLEKQLALITLAEEQMKAGFYANAEPYLTQAAAYQTEESFRVLKMQKEMHQNLGNAKEYLKLLKEMTDHKDCTVDLYRELADHYIGNDRILDALPVLRMAIERTHDQDLTDLYEEHRYLYSIGRSVYEEVTAYHNGGIQVKQDGLWGLANVTGTIVIPCAYGQLSTYDPSNGGTVIAMPEDGSVIALNMRNQMVAKFEKPVLQIGNLSQNIIPLQIAEDKWVTANSRLQSNLTEYAGLGTVHNATLAIKGTDGWGVLPLGGEVLMPYEYDEIIMDELGRCYAQNAVFAKKNGTVYLFLNGQRQSETYEDARPFTDDGWAAVKKNGKWGFIDATGQVQLTYLFEDALSFSQGFAAVQTSGQEPAGWGYINTEGKVVIEPIFLGAKGFSGGYAPVLTESGWKFLELLEYTKGAD